MENTLRFVSGKIAKDFRRYRHIFFKWSLKRPFLSTFLMVVGAVSLLPVVTIATLLPISFLLTYTGVLASHGVFYIIYNILFKGILLGMVLVAVFILSFSVATSLSVFHSYRNQQKIK